jgi:hypothetical protein
LVPSEALGSVVPDAARIVSPDWERLASVLRATFAEERLVVRTVYPVATDLGRLALAMPESRVREPLPIYLHPAVATAVG